MSDAALPIALQALGLYRRGALLAAAQVARQSWGAFSSQIYGLATWWADPRFGSGGRDGTLVSDFTFPRYMSNFIGVAEGDAVACAHTGIINVVGRDGSFSAAGENALPRSDLGLLVEPAATTLVTSGRSEGTGIFTTGSNAGHTSSALVGPKGVTGYFTTVTSTSTSGYRQGNFTVPADTLTRTVSLDFVKAPGGQVSQLLMGYAGGSQGIARINLTTGALVEISAGVLGQWASPVQDLGDRWRLSVKAANNNFTILYVQAMPVVGGIGSCDVGGLMIETSPFMSSYIDGGASRGAVTVLPSADVGGAQGRVAVSARSALGVGSANQVLWQRDDGTANNRFCIYRDTSRVIHFLVVSGGVTQSDRAFGTVADGASFSVEMAWESGVASYRLNGGVPFLEFGVTLPTVTTDRLGHSSSGEQWGGWVKSYLASPTSEISIPAFGDSFNRADTAAGSLGNAPDGQPYDIRAPYSAGSHPLDTHAQIVSKQYVSDQPAATSYACRVSTQPVRHIACAWRVVSNPAYDSGQAAGVATMCLLISGAASTALLATDIGAHVTVSRAGGGLFVQTRRAVADAGQFVTYASRTAAAVGVVADGRLMTCDVRIKPNDDMTVVVNGVAVTVNVPGLYDYPGLIACWERYQTANPTELIQFVGVSSDLAA